MNRIVSGGTKDIDTDGIHHCAPGISHAPSLDRWGDARGSNGWSIVAGKETLAV